MSVYWNNSYSAYTLKVSVFRYFLLRISLEVEKKKKELSLYTNKIADIPELFKAI